MDENKLMMQFLSEELGTNDPKKIQNYLKGLDESKQKALAQKYQQWKEAKKKKQATKAAHGAKLDYVKSLKHICPEGQELYYFKQGGNLKCGCKGQKMEEGAKVEEAKCGAVAKFKKVKKGGFGLITKLADATGSQGGFKRAQQESKKKSENKSEQKEGWRGNDYIVRKKNIKERERQLSSNKTKEETTPPLINKGLHKNSKGGAVDAFKAKCGSKMKKK